MYKNRFICPIPNWLRGELLEYNRLYAYPVIPEYLANSEFQILDSGAYALSKQNRKMSANYIEKLAEHYNKYKGDCIYCVAPDVGGNMFETMKNWDYWHANYDIKVHPVLQFSNHTFDLSQIQYQLKFYKERLGESIPFLFFAKRGATVEEMFKYGIHHKIKYIRSQIKNEWIHFFASGWGKHDCMLLSKMGDNFSVDTINYYQAAEIPQRNLTEWGYFSENKIENAIHNANLANQILIK